MIEFTKQTIPAPAETDDEVRRKKLLGELGGSMTKSEKDQLLDMVYQIKDNSHEIKSAINFYLGAILGAVIAFGLIVCLK